MFCFVMKCHGYGMTDLIYIALVVYLSSTLRLPELISILYLSDLKRGMK
jgi:hypothetical protein